MFSRRAFGKGLIVMAFGGLPPRRIDQRLSSTGRGMLPAPQSGNVIRAREVIAGLPSQPQAIIDATLNYAIAFGAFGTDVASCTPISAAVRLPTNNAAELAGAFVASTVITYTDSDFATATLICGSAISASPTPFGQFELLVSPSRFGNHAAGTVLGTWTVSGSTITLSPLACINSSGAYVFYNSTATASGGAGPSNQASTSNKLVPVAESWHALTLNAAWSAVSGHNTPACRMDITGNLLLTGRVSGDTATSTTITTVPANYVPSFNAITVPCSVVSSAGIDAGETPRLTVDTSGNVTIAGLAAGAATLDLEATFALGGE